MKYIFIILSLLISVSTASAKEDNPPNSALVRIYSLSGQEFTVGGMHSQKPLSLKKVNSAQLDIISLQSNAIWFAESIDNKLPVKMTIEVFDAQSNLTETVSVIGTSIHGSYLNGKCFVVNFEAKANK